MRGAGQQNHNPPPWRRACSSPDTNGKACGHETLHFSPGLGRESRPYSLGPRKPRCLPVPRAPASQSSMYPDLTPPVALSLIMTGAPRLQPELLHRPTIRLCPSAFPITDLPLPDRCPSSASISLPHPPPARRRNACSANT